MPDWTKASLREALLARGAHYLSAAGTNLPNELVQEAVEEFTREHLWEWRRVSTTATLPATIADLGSIQQVLDSTGNVLVPIDAQALRDRYGHLTESGQARWYYRVDRRIAVYPLSTDTFTVHYFSTYGWQTVAGVREQAGSAENSEPLCPPEERDAILLLARQRTHSLNGDNDLAALVREEYERRLEEIRSEYDQVDELQLIEVTQQDWA